MVSVNRQFHDDMRACVRLDDGAYSGWFTVEHGLRQACVLAHLLFNIFFAAVISVVYTHFKVDKDIMNALVHLRKKPEPRGQWGATGGEPALETSLLGILYADYARVVSHLPEQLRKIMGVIVVVCAAFGFTVRFWRPRLRSRVYARRGCRSPPPYLA